MSGPEPYYQDEAVTLYLGDCLAVLAAMDDASISAVVCDPPYGLEFMGREWDAPWQRGSGVGEHSAGFNVINLPDGCERLPRPDFLGSTNPTCRNCGGTRHGNDRQSRRKCSCDRPEFPNTTLPRMQAYQSWCGQWAAGCLRVLKPGGYLLAFGGNRTYHRLACGIEDAGLEVRDSIDWLYGTGQPKSEACLKPAHEPIVMARKTTRRSEPFPGLGTCMVPWASPADLAAAKAKNPGRDDLFTSDVYGKDRPQQRVNDAGRWPPNVILSDEAAADLEGQAEGVSRIFPIFRYEPKAPKSERPKLPDGTAWPTVKPLDLMRWLVRLVTPPGGTVLDLFAGSGTTGEACVIEGFPCILIDKDPVAAELIKTRLSKPIQPCLFGEAS